MTETIPQPVEADQDTLWAQQYTGHNAYVPVHERQFLPEGLTTEELREIVGPAVKNAYINDGLRPNKYGVRIAKVGACKGTSMQVTKAAWRGGLHAVYVENPQRTHGYVVMPTSQEEMTQIEAGQMPQDPLILDSTYAQFLDATTENLDPWEFDGINPTQAKINVGLDRGYHTAEYPFYIGHASVLQQDSSVTMPPGSTSAWDNPIAVPIS